MCILPQFLKKDNKTSFIFRRGPKHYSQDQIPGLSSKAPRRLQLCISLGVHIPKVQGENPRSFLSLLKEAKLFLIPFLEGRRMTVSPTYEYVNGDNPQFSTPRLWSISPFRQEIFPSGFHCITAGVRSGAIEKGSGGLMCLSFYYKIIDKKSVFVLEYLMCTFRIKLIKTNIKTQPVYTCACTHAFSWWPVGGASAPQKEKVSWKTLCIYMQRGETAPPVAIVVCMGGLRAHLWETPS